LFFFKKNPTPYQLLLVQALSPHAQSMPAFLRVKTTLQSRFLSQHHSSEVQGGTMQTWEGGSETIWGQGLLSAPRFTRLSPVFGAR